MHEGGGRWVGSNKVVELKKKKVYMEPRATQNTALWHCLSVLPHPLSAQDGNLELQNKHKEACKLKQS